MIETSAPGLRLRTVMAVLVAYVLLLQSAFGFGTSAQQPFSSPFGVMFPICHQASETAGTPAGAPSDHHHGPFSCALCCAAHGGMALLADIARPHVWPFIGTAPRLAVRESDAHRRDGNAAQPRGPPAFS